MPQLLTQKEAAAWLRVSVSWLRASSCPKRLLPGNGSAGKPVVRYDPRQVEEWIEAWNMPRGRSSR
jgi:hypothetical protein